ncbi:MAG: SLC13 family permease, partial [Betaproteobacteria bacterium]
MSEVAILFAIIAVVIVLFISEKVPVVLVALGTALALYFTGILDFRQALAGLGDPTTIFIASLFVVSAGREAAGVTAWAGQFLIAKAGASRARQLSLIMLAGALLTALISLNGAVAALLPVVVVMAVRLAQPPSQLLMPMVFASHAGSMLAWSGAPGHRLGAG